MQKISLAKILPISIIVSLSILAGANLLQPGLPPTHDGEYHIIRFYEFDISLRQGNFYPRWAPDLNKGYGVPLFNYVYPLPNYVASFFHSFGISFIDAFKLNMFVALLLGAVFMFLWARAFWETWGGVVASVFYTYAPYHFLDIYIRGSVGEVLALALFPAVLWSATKLVREKRQLFLPVTAILFALVIFSHNILALMFFPFFFSYMMFLALQEKRKKTIILHALTVVLLALGLSSIFWLPAIFERVYVKGLEVFDYRDHFVEVYQLIFPSWGSGFSADQATEGLSVQIGVANLFLFITALCLIVFHKTYRRLTIVLFMILWSVLCIFLMLGISKPLWDTLPFIQYTQFPWRFLSLVILCMAFLAGSIVHVFRLRVLAVFLIVVSVVLGIGYSTPAYYHMRDDSYYITRPNFIDGTNSPGNTFNTIWFNTNLPKATSPFVDKGEMLRVNIAYFPGWQVFVDGQKVKTAVDEGGLIQIAKPIGDGKIETKFLDTKLRSFSKLLSLASFVVIVLLLTKASRVRMSR